MDVKSILISIGYDNISESNGYYRTRALYRDGKNPSTLSIHKETGWATDFAANTHFPLEELICLSTNCSPEDAKKITGEQVEVFHQKEPRVDMPLIFNKEEIKMLLPSYFYYKKRGVSEATLKHYQSGLATYGKMSDRYTFPIINRKNQLVGLSGRDVTGKKQAPWKHLGRKANWDYPFWFNKEYIKDEVILIEGISDMLALHEAGIKNALVLFGLSLGKELLTLLLGINPSKIYICTNNDDMKLSGVRPGQDAAVNLQIKLREWFDVSKIEIRLPPKKDFGEMDQKDIRIFFNLN